MAKGNTDRLEVLSLSHLGFAVRKTEDFIGRWGRLLGIEQWAVHDEYAHEGVVLYGQTVEDLHVRVAFGRVGGLAVELIETVEGETCHSRMISARGPGLHHVAFWVDDIEAEVHKAKALGLEVAMAPSGLLARIEAGPPGDLLKGDVSEVAAEVGLPGFFTFLGDPGSELNFTLELLDKHFVEEYQKLNEDLPMRPGEIHR